MSRFIESICFEHSTYRLLEYHQQRIDRTFKKYFPLSIPFNLASQLPKLDFNEKHKVRVVYTNDEIDVEFSEYIPRKINSLRIVDGGHIHYSYKSENRKKLNMLFEERGIADDIIITKNDIITDSSYSNLAFWDGQTWVTPKSCLLPGIKRQYYLDRRVLREISIKVSDLLSFQKVSLINAMLDLEEAEVAIANIS